MYSKPKLVSFFNKYHLGGENESSIINSSDGSLSISLRSETLKIISYITLKDFKFSNCEIGIYYTGKLLKLLSILESEINIKEYYEDSSNPEKVTSITFSDKKGKDIRFSTCDLDMVLNHFDKKPKDTNYDVKIKLSSELVSDILKALGAIDTNKVSFIYEGKKIFIVFGYSSNNSNQIKFELDCEEIDRIDPIHFDGESVKKILTANSEAFDDSYIQLSDKTMKLVFENADVKSEYYLVKLQNTDTDEDSD